DWERDARMGGLPVGVQRRGAIIKGLCRQAEVLILDEPTAVLARQETDELMTIMGSRAEAGTAVVFITHKLREVQAVADEITVIRRGTVVATAEPSASQAELASLMVGRDVVLGVQKNPAEPNEHRLEVSGLTVLDAAGTKVVDDVSLAVHGGEVLAIAGVQGNGQSELAEAILGLREVGTGSVQLD